MAGKKSKRKRAPVSPSVVKEERELEPRGDTLSLPIDVWFEVFLRIPAEDLYEFRRVCKSWNELITSQSFACCHLRHWTSQPISGGLVINCCDDVFYLYDLNSKQGKPRCCKFFRKDCTCDHQVRCHSKKLRVLASCDGLFLTIYAEEGGYQLIVCNPITGSYTRLPAFPTEGSQPLDIFNMWGTFEWALVRNGLVGQYKVLGMEKFLVSRRSRRCYILELQPGSGEGQQDYNSWKELGVPLPRAWLIKACTTREGKVHWLAAARSYSEQDSYNVKILTIDILKEDFWTSPIKMLQGPGHYFASNGTFYCTLTGQPKFGFRLWMLQTVDDVSWLEYEIARRFTHWSTTSVKRVAMLGGTSKLIISFIDDCSMRLCDITTKKRSRALDTKYLPYYWSVTELVPHVSSLVECNAASVSKLKSDVNIE